MWIPRQYRSPFTSVEITPFLCLASLAIAIKTDRPYTASLSSTLPTESAHRPFTSDPAPLTDPQPYPKYVHAAPPPIPANTNSPQAPINVAYIAYGYEDQWTGVTDTSNPPIDILPLNQQDQPVVDALYINPCSISEQNPTEPTCHGWTFPDSTYWSQIWPMYQKVQRSGMLLFASFGGYGSSTFQLRDQDWDTYYPPVITFLRTYGFDGIDLDIEPSFKDYYVPPLSLALKLVQSLRHDLAPEFLITMCPIDSDMYQFRNRKYSGFSTWDLDQAALTTASDGSKMKSINFFVPQFYEGGHPPSVEAYEELIENGNWDPKRVVMLALTSDDYHGYRNLSMLEGVGSNLTGQGIEVGGIGGYEYARAGTTDGVEGWEWFEGVGRAFR